jgi:acyl carrier protein
MGAMELIAYIQDEFGVVIADAEITEENLGTIAAMVQLVEAKLALAA